jgi:hypothetical protein
MLGLCSHFTANLKFWRSLTNLEIEAMPIFVLYPAKPEVLKRIFEVLGEPRDLEVEVLVKDEKFRELFKPDSVERLAIRCSYRPKAERMLELYREYYERYINVCSGVRAQAEGDLRNISHFKAGWYVEGLSAEFDGFKLKLDVRGDVSKAIELIQFFKERTINMEIELSNREAS